MNKIHKKQIILIFLLIKLTLQSQTIDVGFGLFITNQKEFKNGKQFQMSVGKRFSKLFSLSIQLTSGSSKDIVNFYPTYRKYSFNRPNTDTFYNVTETNRFTFKTFLLKSRFYINPNNKLNLFVTPILGVSQLKETKKYKSSNYNTIEKYPLAGSILISNGVEIGLEYPLNKRKSLLLNCSNNFLYIFSKQLLTDVYNPNFNNKNTRYHSIQINLRYEFSKKFINPKS